MQFFCKAMPYTPQLVATSVNSAMKICLACSLCDMKNPMRPKNCFTTDYFDNFFLNKGFQFEKNPDSNVSFCIERRFFFSFFINVCKVFYVLCIGFILDLFSRHFLALNCNFNF